MEHQNRFYLIGTFALLSPAIMTSNAVSAAVQGELLAGQLGGIVKIDNVLIPETFSMALREGMSIPVILHFTGSAEQKNGHRVANAMLTLDDTTLKIAKIEINEETDGPRLSDATLAIINSLEDKAFSGTSEIVISDDAKLKLDLRSFYLRLDVNQNAIGTATRLRESVLGESSADKISSVLRYDMGVSHYRRSSQVNNTNSYLSLNDVLSYKEHHLDVNGSVYGMGNSNQQGRIYKAMYERDYEGRRFAAGMVDLWNLQSLGSITAINSGKTYGFSYGNQASSEVIDNSQSLTPITVFLPSTGEVRIYREGRLLSIQNYNMGSYEVDTSQLPYGLYNVEVEVVVDGKVNSKTTHQVNKLFGSDRRSAKVAWQFWGGYLKLNDSNLGKDGKFVPGKDTYLLGVSASSKLPQLNGLGWSATAYNFNSIGVGEITLDIPISNRVNITSNTMVATDNTWRSSNNISLAIPGEFATVWAGYTKTTVGERLALNPYNTYSMGGTLNLARFIQGLGTVSVSYNRDKEYKNKSYNINYYQNLYSGKYGNLSLRAGLDHSKGYDNSSGMGRYIALDLSLPLAKWLSAGMSHQNGYSTLNVSARKGFDDSFISAVGANVSTAISGDTGMDKTTSGGGYVNFESKYTRGAATVNASSSGSVNANMTASGSVGWQGTNIAMSGQTVGNAGVMVKTGISGDGSLSARVGGRLVKLTEGNNFVPLSPYGRYAVEIMNDKNSKDTFDIVKGRKREVVLYPGNIAVLEPEIKQMVTVFGRIKAEDGSALAKAEIKNHIGTSKTDSQGEFIMDVDKKFPVITFSSSNNQTCEAELDLTKAQGAIWVGDITCVGLSTYAANGIKGSKEKVNEG